MNDLTRRGFLGQSAAVGAGVAATLAELPAVHAAGTDVIRVGLIGCGGRGTGAAVQAMKTGRDVRLVAMGDMFRDRLDGSRKICQAEGGDNCAVKDDHCYVGFDAYKQVIDSNVDVVLLCEPPHFRPLHMAYAIAKNRHIFAEKPVAVDAPGVRQMDALWREAERKKLSLVSGLMLRYEPSMRQVVDRIHNGAIGDIVALQCNYNVGGLWVKPRQPGWTDMEYHLRNWYYFTWLSGDHNVEQHVHCLDLVSWVLKNEYPVRAVGLGGRQARTQPEYGHIFDHHAVVYEYANGLRCFSYCRQQPNTVHDTSTWAFGAKGSANLEKRVITGDNAWIYKGPDGRPLRSLWGGHQDEQNAFFDSIRTNRPINNGDYMTKSTLMAIMGRMATYTGQAVTWEQAWNSKEDLSPPQYDLAVSLPTPPVAVPGVTKFV